MNDMYSPINFIERMDNMYPESYKTGYEISMGNLTENAEVFHAGTKLVNGSFVTAGGRVLAVTAIAENLQSAVNDAYRAVGSIDFEGKHYRTDIGRKALL